MTELTVSYAVRRGRGMEDVDIIAVHDNVTAAWDTLTTELRDLVGFLTVEFDPGPPRDDRMTTELVYPDGSLTEIEELADNGTLRAVVQQRDEDNNTVHLVYGLVPNESSSSP